MVVCRAFSNALHIIGNPTISSRFTPAKRLTLIAPFGSSLSIVRSKPGSWCTRWSLFPPAGFESTTFRQVIFLVKLIFHCHQSRRLRVPNLYPTQSLGLHNGLLSVHQRLALTAPGTEPTSSGTDSQVHIYAVSHQNSNTVGKPQGA
jgi:hypothetical protein